MGPISVRVAPIKNLCDLYVVEMRWNCHELNKRLLTMKMLTYKLIAFIYKVYLNCSAKVVYFIFIEAK